MSVGFEMRKVYLSGLRCCCRVVSVVVEGRSIDIPRMQCTTPLMSFLFFSWKEETVEIHNHSDYESSLRQKREERSLAMGLVPGLQADVYSDIYPWGYPLGMFICEGLRRVYRGSVIGAL